MSNRIKGFTVTLENDLKDEDHMNRSKIKRELINEIINTIKEY